MKKTIVSISLLAICSISFAHNMNEDKNEHKHKQRYQPTPEMKAAFETCRNSVEKDTNGRPNRSLFKKCMEDKGFKRPKHEHNKHDKEHN